MSGLGDVGDVMAGDPHKVQTVMRCRQCRFELTMCVPVRRGVPDALRCDHGEHGGVRKDGAGGIVCPQCQCAWRIDGGLLTQRVEELLSANLEEWRRLRHVVLACG